MRILKRLALLTAILIAITALPLSAPARAADLSYVRVKLSTNEATKIKMSVKGSYIVSEANRVFTDGTLTISGSGSGVSVSHSSEGALYSGKSVTIERVDLSRQAGYLRFAGAYGTRCYLGHFTVTAENGVLTVVNKVPMAHYLYGVVGHEMSNSFPVEALKAQAVAAKCYALLSLHPSRAYDIGDTSSDQVYKGYTEAYTSVIEACDAVSDVALYYNGKVMICYYAASNGGYMLRPSSVWQGRSDYDGAYSEGVDEFDMKNPNSPRELIPLPRAFFSNTVPSALYQLLYPKLLAAVDKSNVIPKGYSFQSLLTIDNVVSMCADGTTANVNHTRARVDATIAVAIDDIPDPTATPKAAATPKITATPEATPVPASATMPPEGEAMAGGTLIGSDGQTPQPLEAELPAETLSPTAEPAATAAATETPRPADTPEPTATPVPLTLELPVSFSFDFAEIDALKIYKNKSLRVMYAVPTDEGFALQRCRYGHGVGMSQRGAEQMANEGYTYEQILGYYYGGAKLGAMAVVSPEDAAPQSEKAPALTNTNATGVVVSETVHLRASASRSSKSLAQLEPGTRVSLTGLFGDWYQVLNPADGLSGYCYADYIEPAGDGVIARGYVSASAVNYRSGPGTNYGKLGQLSKSTDVGVYGLDGDWYFIYVVGTGKEGYISKKYVAITDKAIGAGGSLGTVTVTPSPAPVSGEGVMPTPTPTPRPTPTPTPIPTPAGPYTATGRINATAVNLRKGASTSTASLGKLKKDTKLGVYKKAGSWYSVLVLDTDTAGYVYGKYVSLDSAEEGGSVTSAAAGSVNASSVNIRKGPSTAYSSLGKLSKKTKVSVIGSSGSWYKVTVTATGTSGYVFSKYVTLTSAESARGTAGVVAALINLRTAPSVEASSRVLATMERGDVVTVHSRANGWCYVTYNGTTGYCIASCVSSN